jgi:hypothetical protein
VQKLQGVTTLRLLTILGATILYLFVMSDHLVSLTGIVLSWSRSQYTYT